MPQFVSLNKLENVSLPLALYSFVGEKLLKIVLLGFQCSATFLDF